MITHVAIKYNNTIYILARPKRHGHLIKLMGKDWGLKKETRGTQGFYSDTEEFFNRKDALKHVEQYEQKLIRKTYPKDELFSEDLW